MKLISTNIGKTLSFETFSGVKYSNYKFIALLDASTVVALGTDAPALHVQNMPYMQEPKPVLYTDYLYAKFSSADGKPLYLGIPWVNEDSIIQNNTPNYQLILTAPTQQQVETLRSLAVASGIENFTLSII